eukprot:1268239-Rhodomonas_salina.2
MKIIDPLFITASFVSVIVDCVFITALGVQEEQYLNPRNMLTIGLLVHAILSTAAVISLYLFWSPKDKNMHQKTMFMITMPIILILSLIFAYFSLFNTCQYVTQGSVIDIEDRSTFLKIVEWVFIIGMAVVLFVDVLTLAAGLSRIGRKRQSPQVDVDEQAGVEDTSLAAAKLKYMYHRI